MVSVVTRFFETSTNKSSICSENVSNRVGSVPNKSPSDMSATSAPCRFRSRQIGSSSLISSFTTRVALLGKSEQCTWSAYQLSGGTARTGGAAALSVAAAGQMAFQRRETGIAKAGEMKADPVRVSIDAHDA